MCASGATGTGKSLGHAISPFPLCTCLVNRFHTDAFFSFFSLRQSGQRLDATGKIVGRGGRAEGGAQVPTQHGRLPLQPVRRKPTPLNRVHHHIHFSGVLYQRQNKLEESMRAYERAIRFRPTLALAHLNLGLAISSTGRVEEALVVFRRGAAIPDDHGTKDPRGHAAARLSAKLEAGRALLRLGRPAEAASELEAARADWSLARTPAPATWAHAPALLSALAEAKAALNQTKEAEALLREAVNAAPDQAPAYLKYGKLLAKNVSRTTHPVH